LPQIRDVINRLLTFYGGVEALKKSLKSEVRGFVVLPHQRQATVASFSALMDFPDHAVLSIEYPPELAEDTRPILLNLDSLQEKNAEPFKAALGYSLPDKTAWAVFPNTDKSTKILFHDGKIHFIESQKEVVEKFTVQQDDTALKDLGSAFLESARILQQSLIDPSAKFIDIEPSNLKHAEHAITVLVGNEAIQKFVIHVAGNGELVTIEIYVATTPEAAFNPSVSNKPEAESNIEPAIRLFFSEQPWFNNFFEFRIGILPGMTPRNYKKMKAPEEPGVFAVLRKIDFLEEFDVSRMQEPKRIIEEVRSSQAK
jgi:hypothetical protein